MIFGLFSKTANLGLRWSAIAATDGILRAAEFPTLVVQHMSHGGCEREGAITS